MKTINRDTLHTVRLHLNGTARSAPCTPRMLLSDFLRDGLGATGTHVGCEHGVCAAPARCKSTAWRAARA